MDAKDVEKTKKEELQPKQVEKILKGGNHTVIIQIEAEVCLNCGERLYKPEIVRKFAQIRTKLKNQQTEDFQVIGQSFRIPV
ncbi:YgiT-type zinc finger protein [Sphaerospermopsis torques-reginae ITEP-024]|uniref:YgiT-type zinc finger protein n=1 Tax=Sphaerospermopsis torques-reginae ITEP-024 TaxID=984208 RepID=A0ABX8X626_9CYAN|nr:YgiT-type zinc finger protein [Sphaerospermopsis torques-reginae ITEP-024]